MAEQDDFGGFDDGFRWARIMAHRIRGVLKSTGAPLPVVKAIDEILIEYGLTPIKKK
jgi:hypothetical protein